jgi:flagellar assembly factor FliW
MKFAEPIESATEVMTVQTENIIQFPLGLLGFEQIKKFVLLSNPDEAPFRWLQVLNDSSLAFLVISPFEVDPAYAPNLPDNDTEFLGLESPEDALVYNIVTLHRNGSATVNLKGPIVVNRHTFIGKQVVPLNAPELPLQHPLPVSA